MFALAGMRLAGNVPSGGATYYQIDFLQHKVLPVGPDEDSSWWHASNVVGVAMLFFYVRAGTHHPSFHVYCSHCTDQLAMFTIACLQDLQAKINAKAYQRHVMFADVENHVRNGYTLGCW